MMNLFKRSQEDKKFKERVEQFFYRQSENDFSHIFIEVKKGQLTLKGHVHSLSSKKNAEEMLQRIPGIQNMELIKNDLYVLDENKIKKSSKGLIDNITGLN